MFKKMLSPSHSIKNHDTTLNIKMLRKDSSISLLRDVNKKKLKVKLPEKY
jgi:hypothetical protein